MTGDSSDSASKSAARSSTGGTSDSREARKLEGREVAGDEAWGNPESEFVYFDYADREKMLAEIKGLYFHERIALDSKIGEGLGLSEEGERELLRELEDFRDVLRDLESAGVENVSKDESGTVLRIPRFEEGSSQFLRELGSRLEEMEGKDKGEVLLRLVENDFRSRLGRRERTLTFTANEEGEYKIENFEEGSRGPTSHYWLDEMSLRAKHLGSFDELREGRACGRAVTADGGRRLWTAAAFAKGQLAFHSLRAKPGRSSIERAVVNSGPF